MQTNQISIDPEKFTEAGEFGWSGAVKRNLRQGSEVLMVKYGHDIQDSCFAIEAELNAEGLNVKFWPAEQVAQFIFWPPRDQ